MKLKTPTKRKKQAKSAVSTELLLAFSYIAGRIVDTQIDWKPGQIGRWDVAYLPDGETPRIEFSLFPEGTIITLRSLNHSEVHLRLEAAALAISECAMNWVSYQAYEVGKHQIGETAALLYHRLHNYIWYNPKSGMTEHEKILIHRYIVPAVPLANGGNPMAKGWFRRKNGKLMYFWYNAVGNERSKTLGSATLTDEQGWVKVGELGLGQLVGRPDPVNATFGEVLDHWLAYGKTKTGEDKDDSTKRTDERNARNYLSHWAERVAKDIEPLEIQQWLDKQSYGLRSKLRSMMSAVYRHGQKWGYIPRGEESNPMKLVSAPCKSDFEAVELSGPEAAAVIHHISDPLVKVLVILIAVTGMRISEALALTWNAADWIKGKIRIRRKWNGKGYGPPKSRMSRKPVEMTKGLATVLEVWRQETMFAKDADLLFPSYRKKGNQPRFGSMIVEDYIRPAAIAAGVLEERDGMCYYDGEVVTRFGFHNLRHGLATWLAEQGTDPAVIQRMLRHSSKDMTMHYIHAKAREAQEQYIAELGIVPDEPSGSAVRVQ